MSLELKSVGVRLPEDAYNELQMLATAGDKDLGEVAREILTEALLGKGHALRLTAQRLSRALETEKRR